MKRTFFYNSLFFILFLHLLILVGCASPESQSLDSKDSIQVIAVAADETFKPIVESLSQTFNALAQNIAVKVDYMPHQSTMEALLIGKYDIVLAGRTLDKYELERIKNRKLNPKINQIGSDAVVFVTHKSNPLNVIDTSQINSSLRTQQPFQLVTDNAHAENILFLQRYFFLTQRKISLYASGSDSMTIRWLEQNPQAIGVVGMSLLSDKNDPFVQQAFTKIKILPLKIEDSVGQVKQIYPSQESLALGNYPFIRGIFVINLDGISNPGTGFVNFLVSERGQRILLKAGLLPYTMPGRELNIVNTMKE